jgi:pimeloyl-ACP methyl ester carboxylesterase
MNNSHGAAESFAAIARYYRTGINDDMQVERLAGLNGRLPLLLIWGRQDVTVRYDGAVEALPRLPGCTLLALDETKHIPHIERPDRVIRALAAHWEGGDLAALAGPGVTVTASAA